MSNIFQIYQAVILIFQILDEAIEICTGFVSIFLLLKNFLRGTLHHGMNFSHAMHFLHLIFFQQDRFIILDTKLAHVMVHRAKAKFEYTLHF